MGNKSDQKSKGRTFLNLHTSEGIFVVGNAWDAVSAKIYEKEGFKAVATTSAGIASMLGYPDGERIARSEMMAAIRRIVSNTALPVSADVEAGYGDSVDDVKDTAREVLDKGAVGLNIEDGLDPKHVLSDVSLQQEKITAIRSAAVEMDVPFVINARTDAYLLPGLSPEERLRTAIARGNAYRDAGAGCVFVPDVGGLDVTTIGTLVHEIDAPLNIIAGAQTPALSQLRDLGVRRVSLGPRPMRAMLALLRRIAREIRHSGRFDLLIAEEVSYAEINGWFEQNEVSS